MSRIGKAIFICAVIGLICLIVYAILWRLLGGEVEHIRVYELPDSWKKVDTGMTASPRHVKPYANQSNAKELGDVSARVAREGDSAEVAGVIPSTSATDTGDTTFDTLSDEEWTVVADAGVPYVRPPDPPPRGPISLLDSLTEDATEETFKATMMGYIKTYYPLVDMNPAVINQSDERVKAEYERQNAALDREMFEMVRDTFGSISPEYLDMLPLEWLDILREEGLIE